jgi:hypothetical protein
MTSTRNFDYDDYVRGFRAACALRGIDPVNGATGYQVVHFLADRRRAEQRRIARKTEHAQWWLRHELWFNDDCSPHHSDTEEDALWALFSETYLLAVLRYVRARRRWGMAQRLQEVYQARDG